MKSSIITFSIAIWIFSLSNICSAQTNDLAYNESTKTEVSSAVKDAAKVNSAANASETKVKNQNSQKQDGLKKGVKSNISSKFSVSDREYKRLIRYTRRLLRTRR